MNVQEILEISKEFENAWKEFFGGQMFFIPFIKAESTIEDPYDEAKILVYDFANKIAFYGQLKDNESLDVESAIGGDTKTDLTVTFVTQSLPTFNQLGIVQFVDEFNVEHFYKITDITRRVMFNNYRIFTKAKLVELADYSRGIIL